MTIICQCGAEISTDDMYYGNRETEIGEEYCIVWTECHACDTEYETSKWGHFDNEAEAIEVLQHYINDIPPTKLIIK